MFDRSFRYSTTHTLIIQGQHIGSEIVRQLLALHEERYASNSVELFSTVDGKRMYERFGFSVVREFHDEEKGDLYQMRLSHSLACNKHD